MDFFDANITIGNRSVIFHEQIFNMTLLIRKMKQCNIKKALICSTIAQYNNSIQGNLMLIEEIKQMPAFLPVWILLPFSEKEKGTPCKLKKELIDKKIKGVIMQPKSHQYDINDRYSALLLEILEYLQMPLFLSFNKEIALNELNELLKCHPKLPIIIRDLSYSSDRKIFGLLDKYENLKIETGNYMVFYGIEEIVMRFGSSRLIFGSNAPEMSLGSAVTHILMSDITPAEKRKIAYENMDELTGRIRVDE